VDGCVTWCRRVHVQEVSFNRNSNHRRQRHLFLPICQCVCDVNAMVQFCSTTRLHMSHSNNCFTWRTFHITHVSPNNCFTYHTPTTGSCFTCHTANVSHTTHQQFLIVFDKIWHRRLEPETKEPFRWGKNPIKVSIPIFTPFYHKSMGILCWRSIVLKHFSDVTCGPIIAVHNSNDASWWLPTPNCQKKAKGHGQGHVNP